jgi:hypothetical protein
MSLPAAHLLNLPRELRDGIYKYLVHEVSFEWKWKYSGKKTVHFKVRVQHAPMLSVLLVCSRMHEELKSLCFKNSDVVLIWNGTLLYKRAPTMPTVQKLKFRKAFDSVTDVKILMDGEFIDYRWDVVFKLMAVARQNVPHLISISIARKSCVGHIYTHQLPYAEAAQPAWSVHNSRKELDLLPDKISEFRLVQLSRVLGVGYEHRNNYETATGAVRYYEENFRHSVVRYEVYVYAIGDKYVRRMGFEDVELLRLTDEYPEYFLKRLSTDEVRTIAQYSNRIWGWEELGEDEIAVSEAVIHVAKEDVAEIEPTNNEGFALWFE